MRPIMIAALILKKIAPLLELYLQQNIKYLLPEIYICMKSNVLFEAIL
jgi:hypothetical protein